MSAKLLHRGGVGIVLTCLFIAYATSLSFAQTAPVSPWIGTTNPTLEKLSEVDLTQPLPESIIGNRDCQDREVVTRPKRFVAPLQSKVSHQSCVVDTGYGAYTKSGYLQRAGSSVFGLLGTSTGGTSSSIPIPRSPTGMRVSGGAGYGAYLFFYDNLDTSLSSSAIFNGEVTHKLPATHTTMLKDGANNLLAAETGSISFSANGDWMVADLPSIGTARVNVKTKQVLPFGDAPNYASGLSVAMRTAISPDGRYAIVASRNFEILRLYDLSTCGVVPNVITKKVTCTSRDLLPFMRQQIPGFTSLASVRFRSNYTLELYANSIVGPTTKLTRYVATAAGRQTTGFQYLALGDSFASGEGAYQYKAATDVNDNRCHLSQRSYPYLISSVLGYGQYESVACSGAVIEDLVNNSEDYREKNAQAKGRFEETYNREIYSNYLPGYRSQLSFFGPVNPSVVTISAGGNDIGFGDIILRCVDTDTCYDSYEDRLEVAQLINAQFDRLTSMYNEIKTSADPRAKIYVIGYPQIADPDGKCDMNVHLNHDELVFAEQLVSYLNSVIKKAAENAGVFYVDVEDAFNGYRMCEAPNSWNTAVNGLTAGNDQVNLPFVHGPIGNESFHPNALGHDLLKTKILQKTTNFTAAMPAPNPTAKPTELDATTAFLQAPKTNRIIRSLKHYTGTDGGVITAGKRWTLRATNLDIVFAANSKVQAVLRSNPLALGEYILNQDGTINIAADIPSTLSPGFHTLHLYGKNSSGEDIDVYKTVYVTTGSPCLVPLSGQDTDKDGTDDACDGFIAQPPLVVTPAAAAITQTNTPTSSPSTETSRSDDNPQPEQATTQTTARAQPAQTQTATEPQTNTQTPTEQTTVLAAQTETPTTKPLETIATTTPTQQSTKNILQFWPILALATLAILFLLFITLT